MEEKKNHGGKRIGAGRKPTGKTTTVVSFSLKDNIAEREPDSKLANMLFCEHYKKIDKLKSNK